MKVFISWSGEPSRSIARALDGWIESVVQHVDAWMSDEEITSGQRWSEAIAKSLDETDFGIVCLTRANQHAPWLVFEAGALAKSVTEGRIVPLCIDLKWAEVTGPLTGFQGRPLDEDGVRRLVQDLNDAAEKRMPKDRLDVVFKNMWPDLQAAIDEAAQGVPSSQEPQRSEMDMLAEVVDTVRRMERTGQWLSLPSLTALSTGWASNETLAASKAPPRSAGPDLSGRTYVATYGPLDPTEEASKSED